jgi:hypothetical protein
VSANYWDDLCKFAPSRSRSARDTSSSAELGAGAPYLV